ncbi:hypothetical protein OH491_09985 [Termitidicoccus mucosus]|uniref:Uncharacterized protein n=1 Tax=Termitidicoccus mucosus TaxID=1184151 RepID=A0A178IFK5_9BACT|nr:hypothetical protein AW736_17360 [Opitutaceae bacterium TSB47]
MKPENAQSRLSAHAAPAEARAWAQLQAGAAARLPGDFAVRILRAHRLAQSRRSPAARFLLHPFALSAYTAAACLFVVALLTQSNREINQRRLAEWQDIEQQAANLEPL